ncbi:hypothetical protein Q3G72_000387 [Acer saccharum]|nr:hypothetical protein Q3G72_000387 [Acer saccharum]
MAGAGGKAKPLKQPKAEKKGYGGVCFFVLSIKRPYFKPCLRRNASTTTPPPPYKQPLTVPPVVRELNTSPASNLF